MNRINTRPKLFNALKSLKPEGLLWLLILPSTLYLFTFFVYPILQLLSLSIFDPDFTLRHYKNALTARIYLSVLINSFRIAGLVTFFCLLLGYPLAYVLANVSPKVRNLLIIGVVLPHFTSVLVRSYAWLVILGRQGVLNETLQALGLVSGPVTLIYNTFGLVVGMTHVLLPIMVLALYSVMVQIDMDLIKVSSTLGANKIQTFLRIYFPLSLPGVGAGCLLVFIIGIGYYVTPALLGGIKDTMLSMLIATQIQELLNWGFAGALSVILLIATLCVFLIFNKVMGLDRIWGGDKIRESDSKNILLLSKLKLSLFTNLGYILINKIDQLLHIIIDILSLPFRKIEHLIPKVILNKIKRSSDPGSVGFGLFGIVILLQSYLIIPIFLIIPLSFTDSLYLKFPPSGFSLRWYQEVFTSPAWGNALALSVKVALGTTLLTVCLGFLAAFAFVRAYFPFKRIFYSFILAPLVVPLVVVAVSLYYFYNYLNLNGTLLGLILAHTAVTIPIVFVLMAAAIKGLDVNVEHAAITLGANPFRAFFQITLPSLKPTIIVGSFFSFIHSFDEVVIASFIGGFTAETLPKLMFDEVVYEIKPTLAALSSMLVVFSTTILLLIALIQRKKKAV